MKKDKNIALESEKLLSNLAEMSEEELSRLLIWHNQKYFLEADPEISDDAFDKLAEALKFINPKAQALEQVGHFRSMGKIGDEVVHQRPMLSLEKCYDDATFFKWAEKINSDFVVMPKIDGVACSIIYSREGLLLKAATRGDGITGENITKNVVLIPGLPASLAVELLKDCVDEQGILEIRGEVFLPCSIFNEKFANDFVNPRNLAAGVLKLKEADHSKNKQLKFFPYDLRGSTANSEDEKFEMLKNLGFSMMPWRVIDNDENATKIYLEFLQSRSSFDYEIDGVVYRANSLSDQMRLGETAHHPRYAIAYKFHGESAQTKLLSVEWSVARSGAITPVAIVEPVFVSGASISRTSLHNLGIFLRLDLREDTLVEINRRGGVIPYLERVLSRKGEPLLPPDTCPSCSGPVLVEKDFLLCAHPHECEEVVMSKLMHFCHVLGIEGLGEKMIRKLIKAGIIKSFGDIFRIKFEQLLSLDRMGEVLAHKLVDEIQSKKEIDLPTFLKSLGINEIGSNCSQILAANFHSLENIRNLSIEDILPVHGLGESIATSLLEGLKDNSTIIDDLLKVITVKSEEDIAHEADASHPVFAKSFVFTGKMAHLERKSAQDMVKRLGGKALGAISKHVDYLVIGDEGSALLGAGKKSTKQKSAEKLASEESSIKIISESEFIKMISNK